MNEIFKYKKEHKLSWNALAECLPITGDSLRIAFNRDSVDEYYIDTIKKHFNIGDKKEHTEQKEAEINEQNTFKGVPAYPTDVTSHMTTRS